MATIITATVAFTANIIIDNPWAHGIIRKLMNDYLTKELNLTVQFHAIEVTALPPGANIYGVSLDSIEAKQNILKASQIELSLSPIALILGEVKISDLKINELKYGHIINIEDTVSKNSILTQKSRIPWPPPFPIPTSRIKIENSQVNFRLLYPESPGQNFSIETAGLEAELYTPSWHDISAAVQTSTTRINFLDSNILENGSSKAKITIKKGAIHIENLQLNSPDLNASSEGHVTLVTDQVSFSSIKAKKLSESFLTDLDIELKTIVTKGNYTALGRLLSISDTHGEFTGNLETVVKVPLEKDDDIIWKINGLAKSANTTLNGFSLGDTVAKFTISDDRLYFKSIKLLQQKRQNVVANGTLLFNDKLSFDFNANLEGKSFVSLLGNLKVKDFDILDGNLFGKDLKITGTGYPFSLAVNGISYLENLISPALDFKHKRFRNPPDCLLNIKIKANNEILTLDNSILECFKTKNNSRIHNWNNQETLNISSSSRSAFNLSGAFYFENYRGMDLNIKSKSLNLGIFTYFSDLDMTGVANIEARVNGPYDKIQLKTKVDSENTVITGFKLGEVKVNQRADFNQSLIYLDSISAITENGGLLKIDNATLKLDARSIFNGKVAIKNIDENFIQSGLKYWAPSHKISFSIQDLEGQLSGPIQYPLLYRGSLVTKIYDGQIDDTKLFSSLNGKIDLYKDNIQAKNLILTLGNIKNKTSITLSKKRNKIYENPKDWLEQIGGHWQNHFSGKITTIPGKVNQEDDLALIPILGKKISRSSLQGHLEISGNMDGTLIKPSINFKARILSPRFLGSDISPITLKGNINSKTANLYEISQSANSLLGRLKVDISKNSMPYSMFFTANKFDIRSLGTSFFYKDPRNYAYLDGELNLSGSLDNFWRSKGYLNIDNIQTKLIRDKNIDWTTYSMKSEKPIKIDISSDGWNFSNGQILTISGDESTFEISTNENKLPKQVGISIFSEFNAKILKNFIPGVDSSKGHILTKINISGNIQDPDISVNIQDKKIDPFSTTSWSPLSLNFTNYPPSIDNIRMDIGIKNGQIVIEEFTADKGNQGKIESTGKLDVSNNASSNSSITILGSRVDIRRFPVAFLNFDTDMTYELQLSGNALPLKLAGNINLDKAQSSGEFDIRNQIIDSIYQKKLSTGNINRDPILKLDLAITSESIRIRNRNMIATLSADLKVLGTEAQPLILGAIDINEGKIFYKRDFKIRRGSIKFQGANYPPDPFLDIMADAVVSQYTVQIAITGYASRKKVEMSIDPPTRSDGTEISKVEMLILLNQGKLPEINSETGKIGDLAKVEAANLAISQFEQPLEKLFDLSGQTVVRQVYLDTVADDAGKIEPRINLPFHLSDDINLIFQIIRGSDWKFSSEYTVHDSILVTGSMERKNENENVNTESEADTGLDLKFRFSFP